MQERCYKKDLPQRNKTSATVAGHTLQAPVTESSIAEPQLMRKASCACGGGCPSCQGGAGNLKISNPTDAAEIEADHIADQVMRMPAGDVAESAHTPAPIHNHHVEPDDIHRKCDACEEDEIEEPVLRKEANVTAEPPPEAPPGSGDKPPSINSVVRSGGAPLDYATRGFFEPRFGIDLGHVRIHTGQDAGLSARSINAQAYTLGSDIVFGNGQYQPADESGKSLLAHELTHVVQQSGTGRDASPARGAATSIDRLQAQGSVLMRQPADEEDETGDMPEFGELEDEPGCPANPAQLGKVPPEKPCPPKAQDPTLPDQVHKRYQFCVGSDVLKNPGDRHDLREFARTSSSNAQFTVHAFASKEGVVEENVNLACHRANRVARELIAAGVPGEQIDIFGMGVTEMFARGNDEKSLSKNRVVAITWEVPEPEQELKVPDRPEAGDTAAMLAFAEKARERIQSREYRLAADAYMSRWSCGRMPTLAEAVRRANLIINEHRPSGKFDDKRQTGDTEEFAVNTIELSQDIFVLADNPLSCAMARIADLAFHHMVSDRFKSDKDRHSGGQFLVNLAGIDRCREEFHQEKWDKLGNPQKDPHAGVDTECGEQQPAPGPLESLKKQGEKEIPEFSVPEFRWKTTPGSTKWEDDAANNRGFMVTNGFAFEADAEVQATGRPEDVAQYDLGYVQTVVDDVTTIDYASGHRVIRQIPGPLRDSSFITSSPPWFDHGFIDQPDATGFASPSMHKTDGVDVPIEFTFFDPRKERPVQDYIDTASRQAKYITFLVARRRGEPLDRFSTIFLKGAEYELEQNVDVLAGQRLDPDAKPGAPLTTLQSSGKGTFRTKLKLGSPDEDLVRFTGPVPTELRPEEKITFEPPPSRSEAGKISPQQFRDQVLRIANELDPRKLGLVHTTLTIEILFDKSTGRIALPGQDPVTDPISGDPVKDPETGDVKLKARPFPITVRSAPVGPLALLDFRNELFMRIRKKDFLLDKGQDMVLRQASPGSADDTEKVLVLVFPDRPRELVDKPGVRAKIREAWKKTQDKNDEAGDDFTKKREFRFDVIADRQGSIHPMTVRQGGKPFLKRTPGGFEKRFPGGGPPKKPDPDFDTFLGTVHTHPEQDPPSPEDQQNFKDTANWGEQHIVVNPDFVFVFRDCDKAETTEKCQEDHRRSEDPWKGILGD